MRRLIECHLCLMSCGLRAASLLETVVAAVLSLTLFIVVMELLPRLTVHGDDAFLIVEADYRVGEAFEKYGTGFWPSGEYAETFDWGLVTIHIEPYRDYMDMQVITVSTRLESNCKYIFHQQIVRCRE